MKQFQKAEPAVQAIQQSDVREGNGISEATLGWEGEDLCEV